MTFNPAITKIEKDTLCNGMSAIKSLTEEDKQEAIFRAMTSIENAKQRWVKRRKTGLSDMGLSEAIRYELGIAGGSSGGDRLSVSYQGAGLKIWASWAGINPYEQQPIFEGKQTIAMARLVFSIPNPDDQQMSLL